MLNGVFLHVFCRFLCFEDASGQGCYHPHEVVHRVVEGICGVLTLFLVNNIKSCVAYLVERMLVKTISNRLLSMVTQANYKQNGKDLGL